MAATLTRRRDSNSDFVSVRDTAQRYEQNERSPKRIDDGGLAARTDDILRAVNDGILSLNQASKRVRHGSHRLSS